MHSRRYLLNTQSKSFDFSLLLIVSALVLFGLVMVYDASVFQALNDFKNSLYYIKQQIIWVILGSIGAIFLSFFDYHYFKKFAPVIMGGSVILMLAVFIPGLGVSGGGAHRWLNLGFFTIQPAEIVKLATVIYLAAMFEKKVRLLPFLGVVGTVSFITAVLQKDLGSSIVFIAMSLMIYFVSGGVIWYLLASLPLGVIVLWILIATSAYRVKRVLAFLDPFSDTQGFTYHIAQVLIALGSGGFFGLGLGQSRQKFEYIPEVSTDSIFAIVGEELGFIGSFALICLFVMFIAKGLKIATNAQDNFGRILAIGITAWIGIQAAVNLSAMVALLPLTGVPLPFISYGGSALLTNLAAVGILLNISKQKS